MVFIEITSPYESFMFTLVWAFALTRLSSHLLHDRENYGTPYEKSKTITFLLRKITKKDIHHIHLGAVVLIILTPLLLFWGITKVTAFFLAWSISTIVDQIFLITIRSGENHWKIDYFSKESVLISAGLHLAVMALAHLAFLKFSH